MRKCFVVMSGLPGRGKTTLARRLAPHLSLPVIDKDEILERLFESQGSGDASWRRRLSRESDALLQAHATNSDGAILVSHWRLVVVSFAVYASFAIYARDAHRQTSGPSRTTKQKYPTQETWLQDPCPTTFVRDLERPSASTPAARSCPILQCRGQQKRDRRLSERPLRMACAA